MYQHTYFQNPNVEISETYREVVKKFYDVGIIDNTVKEKLLEIIGLRTIIVHMYADKT